MPYRKYAKRKYVKRRQPMKKTISKIVDSKLNHNIETKHQRLDFNYTNALNAIGPTYSPIQGLSDVSNRIGDTITPTSMNFKLFFSSSAGNQTTFGRMLVIRWKGNNVPSYLDIFETLDMNSHFKQDQRSNFNVLHDKVYTVQPYGGAPCSKYVEFTIGKLSHKNIEFLGDSTSYTKNGIYLIYTGARSAASPFLDVDLHILLRYKDA